MADASPPPKPERPSHRAVVPIVALVFLVAVTNVTSYDTWVHLSLGRWMSEHRRIPRTNLLSHTQPERPTVDHQWLFQLGLYTVWRWVGVQGAILLKAAVVAAAFGFAAATALRKGAHPVLTGIVALVAAYAARFRFTLRPQVVAFLLLSVYLYVLERWRAGRSRGLLVLLPLQVLWANVHGSAVVGWALTAAYAAGEGLRAVTARRLRDVVPAPRPARAVALLGLLAAVLLPLTLLNANGARVLTEPFALARAQQAAGLKEFLLDRASLPWAELTGRHLFFSILAVVGLVTLAGSLVRRDWTEAGLFAGLLAAAVHSQRFVGLFAVAGAPVVARNLSAMAAALRRGRAARPPRPAPTVAALVAACMLMELAARGATGEQPSGLGLAPGLFPEQEVALVQERYPHATLFNEWEHGGYIAWHTRRPVFLDSRGLLAYDAGLVRRYVEAWTSRERYEELMAACGASVALVERPPLRRHFRDDPRWVRVHQGPVCSVFVRQDSEAGEPTPGSQGHGGPRAPR